MKKVLKTIGQIVNHGLLGGVLTNKKTVTSDSPIGSWDKPALAGSIFSSIVTIVVLYLFATGKLTFDQLTQLIGK